MLIFLISLGIPYFSGILRYQVDFQSLETFDDLGDDFDLEDY